MKHVPQEETSPGICREVYSVTEFCRRYRLEAEEEKRLISLLGRFATRHELVINLRRSPVYR